MSLDRPTLVAALTKTQGQQRFSDAVLTNTSGFTGIDGLFRFRPDGTNQRGLAVSWLDFSAPIGVGGLWLSFFLWRLKAAPLLPQNDPGQQFAFSYAHAH